MKHCVLYNETTWNVYIKLFTYIKKKTKLENTGIYEWYGNTLYTVILCTGIYSNYSLILHIFSVEVLSQQKLCKGGFNEVVLFNLTFRHKRGKPWAYREWMPLKATDSQEEKYMGTLDPSKNHWFTREWNTGLNTNGSL